MATLECKVAEMIGADRVVYQELQALQESILEEASACAAPIKSLDSSCFDGNYVTKEAVGGEYFHKLARTRTSDRGEAKAMHNMDRLEIPKKAKR